MFAIFVQVFLGWPAMIASLGLALAGVLFKKQSLSVAGGVLLLLPAWYLSHYSILFMSLPLFLFGSADLIAKHKMAWAFLAVAPALILIGMIGLAVLTQ